MVTGRLPAGSLAPRTRGASGALLGRRPHTGRRSCAPPGTAVPPTVGTDMYRKNVAQEKSQHFVQ